MRSGLRSSAAVLAIAGTLLALLPSSALGAGAAATSKWGWVTVRQASASYVPAAKDQGSSAGGMNQVFHTGIGEYVLLMRGIADNGGTVLVTPFGTARSRCMASFWTASGADEVIGLNCYAVAGQFADSGFVASFLAVSGTGGRVAYAWVDDPGSSTSTPDLDYQYASRGDHILASRTVGEHVAVLPHLGTAKGHVQVTAFDIRGAALPAVCNVEDWHSGFSRGGLPPDMVVTIWCWNSAGARVDDRLFELLFTQTAGLKGSGGTRVAYLLANQPSKASYVPNAAFRFSSAGGTPTVTRSARGVYGVKLPGMPKGGAAQVTVFGRLARHCVVSSIRTSGSPQKVGVRCFDFAGHAADAKFTLSYAR